jgi:hypothetical protein
VRKLSDHDPRRRPAGSLPFALSLNRLRHHPLADESLTFDAWWPEIPAGAGLGGVCPEEDEPAGFLFCQHINYNGLAASPEEGFVGRLYLSIDPASGVEMPQRGQWIRVTGRFDHPRAPDCAGLAPSDQDPIAAEFLCRLQFAPSEVVALGA